MGKQVRPWVRHCLPGSPDVAGIPPAALLRDNPGARLSFNWFVVTYGTAGATSSRSRGPWSVTEEPTGQCPAYPCGMFRTYRAAIQRARALANDRGIR